MCLYFLRDARSITLSAQFWETCIICFLFVSFCVYILIELMRGNQIAFIDLTNAGPIH